MLTLPMGSSKLPGIAVEDIGKCAYAIFKEGPTLAGKKIGIAGDHPTGEQMAAAIGRALGETVRYQDVAPSVYRSFGFPGAEDMGNMFQFYQEFEAEFCASRPLDGARALNPVMQTFDQWAQANAARIPVEPATQ